MNSSLKDKRYRWSIPLIKQHLEENNRTVDLLSTVYKNTKSKLLWKCKVCDHQWDTKWELVKSGCGCPDCAGNIPFTYQQVVTTISEQGFEVLPENKPEEFKNSESHLKVRCLKDGYEWSGPVYSLMKGLGCRRCSNKEVYTFESMKNKVESKINATVISSEEDYINVREKISLKCNNHQTIWESTPDKIFRGQGCPDCANERRSVFNPKLAEKHKESWITKPSKVYIIRCFNEDESFYKIGISTVDIKHRFSGKAMPYSFKEVLEISTNRYYAVHIEAYLHKLHTDYWYNPSIKFAGRTECFTTILDLDYTEDSILSELNFDLEEQSLLLPELYLP